MPLSAVSWACWRLTLLLSSFYFSFGRGVLELDGYIYPWLQQNRAPHFHSKLTCIYTRAFRLVNFYHYTNCATFLLPSRLSTFAIALNAVRLCSIKAAITPARRHASRAEAHTTAAMTIMRAELERSLPYITIPWPQAVSLSALGASPCPTCISPPWHSFNFMWALGLNNQW